jgi:hypothetical protein
VGRPALEIDEDRVLGLRAIANLAGMTQTEESGQRQSGRAEGPDLEKITAAESIAREVRSHRGDPFVGIQLRECRMTNA